MKRIIVDGLKLFFAALIVVIGIVLYLGYSRNKPEKVSNNTLEKQSVRTKISSEFYSFLNSGLYTDCLNQNKTSNRPHSQIAIYCQCNTDVKLNLSKMIIKDHNFIYIDEFTETADKLFRQESFEEKIKSDTIMCMLARVNINDYIK